MAEDLGIDLVIEERSNLIGISTEPRPIMMFELQGPKNVSLELKSNGHFNVLQLQYSSSYSKRECVILKVYVLLQERIKVRERFPHVEEPVPKLPFLLIISWQKGWI